MITFSDLKFHELGDEGYGIRASIKFDNGYGASVIRTERSVGGAAGLYELAVLDCNGDLTYDTPITDDVLGRLTEDDVIAALNRIAALNMKKYRFTFRSEAIFEAEDWKHAHAVFESMDLGNTRFLEMTSLEQL